MIALIVVAAIAARVQRAPVCDQHLLGRALDSVEAVARSESSLLATTASKAPTAADWNVLRVRYASVAESLKIAHRTCVAFARDSSERNALSALLRFTSSNERLVIIRAYAASHSTSTTQRATQSGEPKPDSLSRDSITQRLKNSADRARRADSARMADSMRTRDSLEALANEHAPDRLDCAEAPASKGTIVDEIRSNTLRCMRRVTALLLERLDEADARARARFDEIAKARPGRDTVERPSKASHHGVDTVTIIDTVFATDSTVLDALVESQRSAVSWTVALVGIVRHDVATEAPRSMWAPLLVGQSTDRIGGMLTAFLPNPWWHRVELAASAGYSRAPASIGGSAFHAAIGGRYSEIAALVGIAVQRQGRTFWPTGTLLWVPRFAGPIAGVRVSTRDRLEAILGAGLIR